MSSWGRKSICFYLSVIADRHTCLSEMMTATFPTLTFSPSAYSEYSPLFHPPTPPPTLTQTNLYQPLLRFPFHSLVKQSRAISVAAARFHSPRRLGSTPPLDRETSRTWQSPITEYLRTIKDEHNAWTITYMCGSVIKSVIKSNKANCYSWGVDHSPNAQTSDLVVNLLYAKPWQRIS